MKGDGSNNPRKPLYWKLLGYSDEDSISNAKLECKKCSPRCIEYWTTRGFSEEEGKDKIKKIQNNGDKNVGSKRTKDQKLNMSVAQKRNNTIEYWIEKFGEELGTSKFEEYKKNQSENGRSSKDNRLTNNPNSYTEGSIRRIEYWIKNGYNLEESKLIVSKVQSRGIDFYIKKYGIDLGIKKWKEKNQKWYNSFYNSGKDLVEINEKRKLNSHVGYYTENTIVDVDNLNFYMIVLIDSDGTMIVKYGLTKQDNISKRWSVSLNYNLLMFKKMKANDAIILENKFHKNFKRSYSPTIIKTTECFEYTDFNINEAMKILEEFKHD